MSTWTAGEGRMPAAAASGGARIRSLAAVLASCFCVGMTLGMATPLVSLAMEARGYGSLTIGLMAASYSLAMFAIGPFVPALLRRPGPVAVMIGGLAVAAASLAAFPHVAALGGMFVLRFLMGVGGGLDWVASETWISAMSTDRIRGRVVGVYTTVWGGGLALGPILLIATGTGGPLPFAVAAGILALAFLPVLLARGMAPSLPSGTDPSSILRAAREARVPMAASFLSGMCETGYVALFPIYGLEIGMSRRAVVLVTSAFAAGTLLLQPAVGWLADRVDRRRLLVSAAALVLACLAAVPVAQGTPVLWPVVFLWGGGAAGLYTLGLVLLGDRFSGLDLPAANTGYVMSYTLGMVLGPVMGGAGMRIWSPHGLIAALAIPVAAFLALSWVAGRRVGRGVESSLQQG